MYIAVDLDGTLAVYNPKDKSGGIGEPVPTMVEKVKAWKADGHKALGTQNHGQTFACMSGTHTN